MIGPLLHTWNLNLGYAKRLVADIPDDKMALQPAHGAGVNMPDHEPKTVPKQPDSYFENGLLVYTAAYHLERGSCCGSGCRHCPYEPRHVEGNTKVPS